MWLLFRLSRRFHVDTNVYSPMHLCSQMKGTLALSSTHYSTGGSFAQHPEKVPHPTGKTPNTDAVRTRLMYLTFPTQFACTATTPLQITFDLYISSRASSCLGGKFFLGCLFSRHGMYFPAGPMSPPLADSYKMERTQICPWKAIPPWVKRWDRKK